MPSLLVWTLLLTISDTSSGREASAIQSVPNLPSREACMAAGYAWFDAADKRRTHRFQCFEAVFAGAALKAPN